MTRGELMVIAATVERELPPQVLERLDTVEEWLQELLKRLPRDHPADR